MTGAATAIAAQLRDLRTDRASRRPRGFSPRAIDTAVI